MKQIANFFVAVPVLVALLLSGCASGPPIAEQRVPYSVAILGVVEMKGVMSGKSSGAMALELGELIADAGDYQILRRAQVAKAMNSVGGNSAYDSMLANYAASGQIDSADLHTLLAARLPVHSAIIARVEKNQVSPGETRVLQLRDNAGVVMDDRVRITKSTRRETVLSAVMINLHSGASHWRRTYRARPESRSYYDEYSGSSFSGSLAAMLANTMTNGLRTPEGPPAPSAQATLRSLFREVVRNMPVQGNGRRITDREQPRSRAGTSYRDVLSER